MPACGARRRRSSTRCRSSAASSTALYPEKYIFDVAGFPKVLAKDLVKSLAEQAAQFDQPIHLGQRVIGLERGGRAFRARHRDRIVSRRGDRHRGGHRRVLAATAAAGVRGAVVRSRDSTTSSPTRKRFAASAS